MNDIKPGFRVALALIEADAIRLERFAQFDPTRKDAAWAHRLVLKSLRDHFANIKEALPCESL